MDREAITRMLEEDRAEWEALTSLLDAHPDQPLHDPESPEWTARDVYAHLARWLTRSMDELDALLAGNELPPIDGADDEINAAWQQEDSRLTLDEARRRAHEAYERRLTTLESLPHERWDAKIEAAARA